MILERWRDKDIMKLQIIGYDSVKNGDLFILHCIDLTSSQRTVGYKPFVVNRQGKSSEGLWINKSQFVPTKESLNKVIEVDFNAYGRVQNISIVNK